MGIDYNKMRGLSSRLLSDNGRPITLVHSVSGEYDPATGSSPKVLSDVKGVGIFTNYNSYEINNEVAQQGDQKLTFNGANISKGDTWEDEKGQVWRVQSVMNVDPDLSGNIIQKAQLRR